MDPLSSISGLASGVQWRDLVEQIIALDTQRKLDPVLTKKSLAESRLDAWGKWQGLVSKFRDAAKAIRDVTSFSQFKVSGGTSPTSGRTLFSASASIEAAPGSYDVEVIDLARANKLSGSVHASATSALGLAGEFAVNGGVVTVTATDTLNTLRDKINALNSGTSASQVTASVLATGSQQHRLVLTAQQSGASGIELVDDAAGTLQSLGLVDGTKTLNIGPGGGAQTYKVSASTLAIATMMGVTSPPPSTITIGGRVIAVDLTVDSLTSIAAKIAAAGGNASVVQENNGYRLVTNDTVSASDPDGLRALEVLGFTKAGRSGVSQVITSSNTFTDAADATSTTTTLLSDLKVAGNALGIAAGDTVVLQGKRGDGTSVTASFTVGASDTVQTVLDKLNDATSGFGAGTRTATASFVNGQLVLTDNTAGDSLLSLNMSVSQSGGGIINLGQVQTTTNGRLREVVTGSDAQVRVDGVLIQRASNTISDAITGVTLTLNQAEVGSTSTLVVQRDEGAVIKTFNDLASAYNSLVAFRDEQGKEGAPLYLDTNLRANLGSLTNLLLSNVPGATSPYSIPGLAGLSLQADGKLALDANKFTEAMTTNMASLSRLFSTAGYATNADVTYFTSTAKSKPGTYAVDITAAATTPSLSGAGFSGVYADDGTGDTLTISESFSGQSVDVQLDNGDTIDAIVNKLNAAFTTGKMALTATKNGNDLVITGSNYGTAASFTVAYAAGGTDGTAQLGLAAGTYTGTDVAGTIGGLVATGSGQVLTGVSGGVTDGLGIMYTGSATGAQGSIEFVLGMSGMLFNAADLIAAADGSIATTQDTLSNRINELQQRADTVQQALDRRREALVKQFVAMESALARLQQQSTTLNSFIASMNASNQN